MLVIGHGQTQDPHNPSRPQSDGAAERPIRSVVTQISMFEPSLDGSDLQIFLVIMSLRVAVHVTNRLSPAMMLFTREINTPPSLARGVLRNPRTPTPSTGIQFGSGIDSKSSATEMQDRARLASQSNKERKDLRARQPVR